MVYRKVINGYDAKVICVQVVIYGHILDLCDGRHGKWSAQPENNNGRITFY